MKMQKKDENKYYKHKRPEMLQYIPNDAKKICEIGCGEAGFTELYNNENREVWVVEPHKESAEIALKKVDKLINLSIEDAIDELPDYYFNAILFIDSLEHMNDIWTVLRRIKTKLKDDGVMIFSIPNVRYYDNMKKLILNKDWKYTDEGILDRTHLRFFTQKSIYRTLEETGYKIVEINGINRGNTILYKVGSFFINLFTMFIHSDIFYMQFAVVANKIK